MADFEFENMTATDLPLNSTFIEMVNGTNTTTASPSGGYYYHFWSNCNRVRLPPPPSYRPYETAKLVLWRTIPPLIVLVGVLGNILTIIVLKRSTKKMKSTILYLLILAVSDTLFLLNTPVRQWTIHTWKYDFRSSNVVVCKLSVFLTYSTYQFSCWLLVAVTMERVFSVMMPYKVHERCNLRASVTVILSLFLTIFGLNSHILFFMGHRKYGNKQYCQPLTKEYVDFFNKGWSWIHFAVAFVMPFLILLVGNGIIIKQLRASQKERKRMSMADSETLKAKNKEKRAVMIVLVMLNTVFFISQTPTIYFMVNPYFVDRARHLPCDRHLDYTYQMDIIWFWYTFTSLLSYTNATMNFIMYVLSGTRFRGEVKALLCCQPPKSTDGAFESSNPNKTSTTKYVTEQSQSDAV